MLLFCFYFFTCLIYNRMIKLEMRMLRWMCTETRYDRYRIRNDNIKERVGVAPIVEKMIETQLRWFGRVEGRLVDSVLSRVDQVENSQITRGRGRPRKL